MKEQQVADDRSPEDLPLTHKSVVVYFPSTSDDRAPEEEIPASSVEPHNKFDSRQFEPAPPSRPPQEGKSQSVTSELKCSDDPTVKELAVILTGSHYIPRFVRHKLVRWLLDVTYGAGLSCYSPLDEVSRAVSRHRLLAARLRWLRWEAFAHGFCAALLLIVLVYTITRVFAA